MADTIKTESEVYKELYEKSKKENERLKVQAAKTQVINTSVAPVAIKTPTPRVNYGEDISSLIAKVTALEQTISSIIQQLNIYNNEQEKIRTQVRANYTSITSIANLINGGK